MSQSPEGDAGNFHQALVQSRDVPACRMSQSPEGDAGNFHNDIEIRLPAGTVYLSQSPEGDAGNFHEKYGTDPGRTKEEVSIPRRGRRQFPLDLRGIYLDLRYQCLNPPKGTPAISTPPLLVGYRDRGHVSIPRRGRRQFPHDNGTALHAQRLCTVSIPRRGRRQFPLETGKTGDKFTDNGCLNPPKGTPAISTRRHGRRRDGGEEDVSIPRRGRRQFPRGLLAARSRPR